MTTATNEHAGKKHKSNVETSVDHPDELMTVPGVPHAEQPSEVRTTIPVPLPENVPIGGAETNLHPDAKIWEDDGGESGDSGESGESGETGNG